MSNPATPVRTLQEHIIQFEAALVVCLADAKPKAVHRLRSLSRRIEAVLMLLDALDDMPPFRTKARRVKKKLRNLRQAAGKVRDLDIHLELLAKLPEAKGSTATAVALRKDIAELQSALEARRVRRAQRLNEIIQNEQAALTVSLEALVKALKPAEARHVPPAAVLGTAAKSYARLHAADDNTDDEHLHNLRKAAKLSRYLAESTGSSERAVATAQRYSQAQAAGGNWHDWLELAAEAKDALGKKHLLTKICREHSVRHRAGFLRSLRLLNAPRMRRVS